MTELPSSWTTCPIGEVLVSVEMTAKDEPDREIWYVDISSIDNQSNKVVDPKRMALSSAPSRARQKIIAGDTLFSTVRPYLRKIAAVPEKYDGEIASTGFAVLRPAEGIHHRYIFYKSVSHDFVSALTGEQYGVSYPAVKEEQVRSQELQLPPTNEQRRIVERIEAMFDEIDHGVENLKKSRATLGLYRQSLLKSAFEGRLTADWRARNADKLESPETLLARIRSERDTRYKSALDDWQKALTNWRENGEEGKKPSKPRRDPTPDAPMAEQRQNMDGIPDEWQWLQIGAFGFVTKLAGFEYTKHVTYREDGDLPVIKAENAGREGFKVTDYSRVRSEKVAILTRSLLAGGELLMVFVGAGTGNVATVPSDQKYFLGPNIGMIRLETPDVLPGYVEHFLRSPIGTAMKLASVKAVAQPSLSMGTIRQIPVALPSPTEQAEITRILDGRLSAADALEAEIDAGLTRAEALRQSILKQAFSGKLVPQDPKDEPAATLLARIKAEKASKPKKRRVANA